MKFYKLFIFKFFVIGLIAIIAMQTVVLFYLDKVYFLDNSQYVASKIEILSKSQITEMKASISSSINNLTYSFDGKYISYVDNNFIKVINLESGETNIIAPNKGMQITNFKWIYDRNRLIIAEKSTSTNNTPYFKLYYYDTNDNSITEIYDNVHNKSIKIPVLNNQERISQIEMSTLTNLIYLKIASSIQLSRIYIINIMAQKSSTSLFTHNIGNVGVLKADDVLVYENSTSDHVDYTGSTLPITIQGESNFKLIGIDNNDTVYLALISGGKVATVYYGNVLNNNWQNINLPEPVSLSNITLTGNGDVFINNSSTLTLSNLKTGQTIQYNGKFVGMFDGGYICRTNNEVIRKTFKYESIN
jgi:hypothetical protein